MNLHKHYQKPSIGKTSLSTILINGDQDYAHIELEQFDNSQTWYLTFNYSLDFDLEGDNIEMLILETKEKILQYIEYLKKELEDVEVNIV